MRLILNSNKLSQFKEIVKATDSISRKKWTKLTKQDQLRCFQLSDQGEVK